MSHLPSLRSRDVIRFLHKLGFEEVRQKGSHKFFKHPDGRTTSVPVHAGENIGRGLLSDILEDIRMSHDEFLDLY
ncbi:MAG TPA: type II toxin-antitoxin system HicA family toxin [Candidatus Paceibacterota bacterium]